MVATEASEEQIRPHEMRRMREQVGAAVAMRMSGGYSRPVEDLHLPPWVHSIITTVLLQFRSMHPDGLPPPPELADVVTSYQRRAVRLFDEEVARQFTLGDSE